MIRNRSFSTIKTEDGGSTQKNTLSFEEYLKKRKEEKEKGSSYGLPTGSAVKTGTGEGQLSFEQYLEKRKIQKAYGNTSELKGYNDWLRQVTALHKDLQKYSSENDGKFQSADYYASVSEQLRSLINSGSSYYQYFTKYGDLYGDGFKDNFLKSYEPLSENLSILTRDSTGLAEYWSQFADEEEYRAFEAQQKLNEEYLAYDAEAGRAELEALKKQADEADLPQMAWALNKGFNALTLGLNKSGAPFSDKVQDREQLMALIQERQDYYDKATEYQRINKLITDAQESADFETYAKAGMEISNPQYVFDKAMSGGEIGNIVTYSRDNEDLLRANVSGRGYGNTKYTQMTEDEVKVYSYYLAKFGKDKAQEYLDLIDDDLVQREADYLNGENYKFAQKYPVLSSLGSVATSLGSAVEYAGDALQYGVDKWKDPYTAKMDTNSLAEMTNIVRGAVSDKVNLEIGGWDAFDFVYNTTMSGADSMAASFIPGGAAVLGLSAAAQGTNDALERGLSSDKAFWNGAVSGVFEGLFESISIGRFKSLQEATVKGGKDIALNIVKSMLVNASEEAWTEVANILYDTIVNGSLSNYEIMVQKYVDEGLSLEEAEKKAKGNLWSQVLESAASGALMGAGFGAIGSGFSAHNTAKVGKGLKSDLSAQGRELGEITSGILDKETGFADNTAAYKQAQKMQSRLDAGKKVSNYSIGNLALNLSESQMSSAIQSRLGEGSRTVADTIAKAISGDHVSNRALRAVMENDGAIAVINETLGTSFTKDSTIGAVRSAFEGSSNVKNSGGKQSPVIKAFEGMSEDQISSRIRSGLSANVSDKGELDALTDIITDAAMGRSISDADAKKIAANQSAVNAINKRFGVQIKKGATASDVKAAIRSVQEASRSAAQADASKKRQQSSAAEISGQSSARFSVAKSQNGGFDVIAEGNGESGAIMHYETQQQAQAAAYAQTLKMGGEGLKGFVAISENLQDGVDLGDAALAFNAIYNQGRQGKAFAVAKNGEFLTPEQRQYAYQAGVVDGLLERGKKKTSGEVLQNDSVDGKIEENDSAIWRYKSSESYRINEAIRSGRELTAEESAFIEELDRDLEKTPKYSGVTYRNISFDMQGQEDFDAFVAEHVEGEDIIYPAYTSTSKTKEGYVVEGKLLAHIEIYSENGHDISKIGNEKEQEVLFERKTRFDVKSISYDGKTANIVLEEIAYGEEEVSRSSEWNRSTQQRYRAESGTSSMQQMQVAGSTGTNESVSSISKRNPQKDILQRDGLRDIRTEVNSLTESENGHQEVQSESSVYSDNGVRYRGERGFAEGRTVQDGVSKAHERGVSAHEDGGVYQGQEGNEQRAVRGSDKRNNSAQQGHNSKGHSSQVQRLQKTLSEESDDNMQNLSRGHTARDTKQQNNLSPIRKEINSLTENNNGHQEVQGESGVYSDDGIAPDVQQAKSDQASSSEWSAERIEGGKTKEAKPISEIIEQIRHDFGINITKGHVRGKGVLGQYNKRDHGIRTKIANDLPTVSHELGHALDQRYGLTDKNKLTKEMRSELVNALGDLKDSYKQNLWVSEGLAEYMRRFLQNRDDAARSYPEFTKHFLNSLSRADRILIDTFADEINAYYALDADTATSSIRLREEGVPDARTPLEKARDMGDGVYQAWVDANHGIRLFDEATGANTYKLASNAAYSDAIAGQIITGDLTDANGQYVAPGLKAALEGVNIGDKKIYREFGEYLVLRHGPERLSEGMRIFADERKNNASFMEKRAGELEAAHPEFKEAADRLYTFQKQFLKTWAVDTGLLPAEVAEAWAKRWSFYVPFNRAVGKAGMIGAKRGYANQNSTVRKAIGSGLDIVHPVDNIINNIVKMVNAGVRNNVMLEITTQAEKVGADATFLEKVPTPMKKKTADLTGVKAKLHDAFGAAGIGELLAEVEGESEARARANGQASADIRIDMDDAERYEILKGKSLQPQKIEVDPKFDIDFEYLEKNIKSEIEKPLIKKLRELGYLKRYKTDAIEVDFEFTGGGLRKSLNSQATTYGGSFADLAKVVLNLQKLLDNSVLIEIHSDKGAGTDLENKQLVQTFVMMSAFAEGNSIVPVQFEVKQFVDNANRLYLAVALTKIETGVVGNTTLDKNQASTYLLPVSDISIADLFSKINTKDENFFKYIPDGFLSADQIDAKKRALAKDEAKYGKQNKVTSSFSNGANHQNGEGIRDEGHPKESIPYNEKVVNKKNSTNSKSEKSDAWSKVDEIIESAIDDVLIQYGQGKAHGDVVTVLRNGKQEFWKINDALLLESLTSLSQKKMNGIMEAYAVVSRFMTSNITGNNIIWSIFSNFPRDMMTFFTYSKQKNPLKSFPAMGEAYLNKVTGGNAETKNLPYIKEYYALGGGQTSAYTADVDLAKRARKKLKHSTKLQSAAYYANPLNVLSFVSETVESGPRIATYIMMREKGMSPQEAFYESQDITVNFKRGGRLSREFNKAVPFFNASVQGLDKFKRWVTCADVPKAQRAKAIVGRVTMYVAVSAALGALTYALNNGDDEDEENYRLLSNYTKNSYWNIPLGDGKYFAIPKPREIAVLSTFFETTCEHFGGNDYAYDGFGEYAADNFLPPFLSDLVTDGMDGALGSLGIIGVASDLKANKDFLGRPIESTSLSGYESQDRYTRRTSQIAYWLGQAAAELGLDWSPVQIDYFFSQTLGGYWKVQKALFPVGSENVDWTLGVQNTYVKDNQYSNDIVNWMYDKATASEQAQKSNPDDMDIAIEAKLDSNMKNFYSRYYALTKNQKEDSASRRAKRVVLDMIVEYRKATDNGDRSAAEDVIYSLVESVKDTSLLPAVMQSTVKDSEKNEIKLTDIQYVEYQTTYNGLYWEFIEDNLDVNASDAEKVAVIKQAQSIAKERATELALKSAGGGSSGFFEKYSGIDDKDLITFKAQIDLENDKDGGLSQEELIDILEGMVADGLSKEDAYTLFKSRYPTSDKNNPWRWYAP